MKRLLAILVVLVIIFAVLVGLLVMKHSNTPVVTTSQANPFANVVESSNELTNFTTACFKAYVQDAINNVALDNPEKLRKDAEPCFTKDFIDQWPTISANTDSDPVLHSNDFYDSWGTQISSKVVSQSADAATVAVTLGSGTQMLSLSASLQKISNGWRISSVTNPGQ